jgi:hypothetical protein
LLAVILIAVCGCQENYSDKQFLVVDYPPNQPVRYKMISERRSIVDLDPSGKMSKGGKSSAKQVDEKLEIAAALTLLDVDKYGYLTIECKYESVNALRIGTSSKGSDAVESLAGKSANIKMTPAGLIVDDTQLVSLVQTASEKAFSGSGKQGEAAVKSEEMLSDFVALQFYMFSFLEAIKEPLEGLKIGSKWDYELLTPLPLAANVGRKANYTLKEIFFDPNSQTNKAVILSDYELLSYRPKSIPNIYAGKSYRQKGFFGVLRAKPKSLTGGGKIIYDIDKGVLITDIQQYDLEMSAALFLPLPGLDEGVMKVSQKISIEQIQ